MSAVLDAIYRLATEKPTTILLDDGERTLDASQLWQAMQTVRAWVQEQDCRSLALAGDNTLAWIIADLALLGLPVRVVPLPTFFSSAQLQHVLQQAAVDTVLGNAGSLAAYAANGFDKELGVSTQWDIAAVRRPTTESSFCAEYEKITFTSGSTGNAKGVRLALSTLEHTANAIATALKPLALRDHLGLLPLATLLENVAGLYAPLLQGVRIHVRRAAQVGLVSPEQFNPFLLMAEIQRVRPQATILVPQLLLALVSMMERGLALNSDFRFIAVGGGKVSRALLEQARAFHLPVFEGYGLSECGSVVALNLPGADRVGSVGRPLAHSTVRIADDGEILVGGSVMSGYLGDENAVLGEVATGDLGSLDTDGFLYVNGRRKNLFITAFGRNVNPEWVEAELQRFPAIRQVAVFGEALPRNRALIVPRAGFSEDDVNTAVAICNATLPDYACIGEIRCVSEPFSVENGMATANGRLRRTAIEQRFADWLASNAMHKLTSLSME